MLDDADRAVRLDGRRDVGLRERDRLGRRGRGGRQGGEDDGCGGEPPDQNVTCGASRAAGSSIWKYGRALKPNMPAKKLVGTVSMALS